MFTACELGKYMIFKLIRKIGNKDKPEPNRVQIVIFYAILGIAVGMGFNAVKPFFFYAKSIVANPPKITEPGACIKTNEERCD
jgi:hypothetical protein